MSKPADPMRATNAHSKFNDFSLRLSNGATLTGIVYIPPAPSGSINFPSKPLLVGIHGASCCAYNYDISPDYTASIVSDLLSVPFVAFNRPNYLGSNGWLISSSSGSSRWPSAEDLTYLQEDGRWRHEYILPALWDAFGAPNGCTSIVTNSHSLAVPGMLVCAALHARDESKNYPLAGIVLSGMAIDTNEGYIQARKANSSRKADPAEFPPDFDHAVHLVPPLPTEIKEMLMVSDPKLHCCSEELRPLVQKQTTPQPRAELGDIATTWNSYKEKYMKDVKVPVLFAMGSNDYIYTGTRDNAERFCAPLINSPRVEVAIVEGAPHALEWWNGAMAWSVRVGGWAMEVCMGYEAGAPVRSNAEARG